MVRSKQVDPRIAAFRDLETRTANAWKSKFQQQLALAVSYLPTTKPRTLEDRVAVNDLIKLLNKLLSGRPRGRVASNLTSRHLPAEFQVRQGQKSWCIKHGRRRAPASVTNELIADAIKKDSSISADELRRLVWKKGGISAK
jgi:hypothetical protein